MAEEKIRQKGEKTGGKYLLFYKYFGKIYILIYDVIK